MSSIYRNARLAKDRTFDGTFLFAVKTTSIFCHPSCPSPVAKEENVLYFESVCEAMDSGFRPCLRCRPDLDFKYSAKNKSGSLIIDRALCIIQSGKIYGLTVSSLADSLNISDRQLRNLFIENTGLSPKKVITLQHLLFSKILIMNSSCSITDIAFASGFQSIRQFNDQFKKYYSQTPSQMRFSNPGKSCEKSSLFIEYKGEIDIVPTLNFMRDRGIAGVELINDSSYSRTFRTETGSGYFTVKNRPDRHALEIQIHSNDIRCYRDIFFKVRKMFDLDANVEKISEHLGQFALLDQGMENKVVPRLPMVFNPFEFTIRAILGQQISIKGATTLAKRIVLESCLKSEDHWPAGLTHFFPDHMEILDLDLSSLGITKRRQETIRLVCSSIDRGLLKLQVSQPFDKFYKDFISIKGIGDWTVNYVAMRGLGFADSFPASDLAVVRMMGFDEKKINLKKIIEAASPWKPYRAYATMCLWKKYSEGEH
ncbi:MULTISPECIES: DNA-3-methyladenine glycosylase 2 family protein [unclassified Oceanispirochaeta]|uniref:DNA-3-methyladenine glycosylase 2 family protein n=1 Tax=unclassified Oceanispirochaeta TaxID=2635722 RepID=UPI000E09C4D5|nr:MULTISPECIES: Ada metal-binding domain-containing protein [unclassified Oceanispirochaeta]MBF9017949.1 DNA-3-methyladenine glycosylase 2 family protein [Oceanispirochaeta sp. M2]NPD74460.1 DNA-3-methyladenine glycosylase 2 family protein [Oceanispirochaeta sp. M1]RDG29669.1 DNA-3-methyladenine glycosylase 2 family protein [Oceanispirochaeta sp. M1]